MRKFLNNIEIADLLRSVAAAYKISDSAKSKFKIIAYERAADSIEHLGSELKDLFDGGGLSGIPGVGKSILEDLVEIFTTGKSIHFESILAGIDPLVFELIKLPGIGPKTAYILTQKLKISRKDPFNSLKIEAEKGRIAEIDGFGEASQKKILQALKDYKNLPKRHLLNYATEISDQLALWMKCESSCEKIEVLGSLRRKSSTVGDIDLAVASTDSCKTISHFVNYPKISRVIEKGTSSASILLPSGVQVDIIVQDTKSFGSLVQHFTGSKYHNIKLRELALKKNLSLSEKGIKDLKTGNLLEFGDETRFYNYLGLDWIQPELREDTGEIELSKNSFDSKSPGLPNLIEMNDIKADLQIHSSFDVETSHDLGLSSMEEIIKKADTLGYEYLAYTEHNPSQKGHSQTDIMDILRRKKSAVEEINEKIKSNSYTQTRVKHVYNSLEIDMLPDGSLPVSDQGLELLDFALVSIHSSFRLDKSAQTKRVLRALAHPKVKIFAHPTGRKLTEREGVELDWEKIFEYAFKHNKWIEINSDPMRLDLPDYLVHEAVNRGVKLTLGTDAHHIVHMDNMVYGIYVARRGWAQKENILNTLSYSEFDKMIQ